MSVLVLVMSCGSSASGPLEDDLFAIADAPPSFVPPTLSASIRYSSARSAVGWGSFDLTARPESHEFRVGLMVGLAAPSRHWGACRRIDLVIDGRRSVLAARYSGVPMEAGVYDAVTAELTISDVRAMSRAQFVTAYLCGEAVTLPSEHLGQLDDFVRRFEKMASYDGPPPPPRRRGLDEDAQLSNELVSSQPLPV